MRKKGEKWIIDSTFESSFYHFSFLEKKKKKCSFLFSFGLIQSQNWRMGARERRKKMKWISISPYIYTKSKRSRCVCGSAGLSLSRISWMQSVSILHVPTDWSSRRRKIFLHPRSHHHIYSASISQNICVCVCVCFVFVRSSRNFSDWINFCSASEMSGNRRTLAFQLYPVRYLLYSLGAQVRRRKMK